MGTVLWWFANAVVLVGVLPLVSFLAARVVKALRVVEASAADIRTSVHAVAAGIPAAMAGLRAVATGCERLAEHVGASV